MNKKEFKAFFKEIVTEAIREELPKILTEMLQNNGTPINEHRTTPSQVLKKYVQQTPVFSKNKQLQNLLSDSYNSLNDDQEVETGVPIGKTVTTEGNLVIPTYEPGDELKVNSVNEVIQSSPALQRAFTRDYRQLMKKTDEIVKKKRG